MPGPKTLFYLGGGLLGVILIGYLVFKIPGQRPVLAQSGCVSATDILNNYQLSCMFLFKPYGSPGYSVYAPVSKVAGWIHASMHACQSPVTNSPNSVRTLDATQYIYTYGYSSTHGFSGSTDSSSNNTNFNNSYVGPLCDNVTATQVDKNATPFQPDFDYVILADPVGIPKVGDVNNDGQVDIIDYETETHTYNTTNNCTYDLVSSVNCLINLFDVSKLMTNLGL